jgi:predicted enzyme related to lactoylglutathione lyase
MTADVIHFQLRAADPDALAGFYEHVLGWRLQPATMTAVDAGVGGRYRWLSPGPHGIDGGIVEDQAATGAVVVVEVDDLAATLERAKASGAIADSPPETLQLVREGTEPQRFEYTEIVDPQGNRVAFAQL